MKLAVVRATPPALAVGPGDRLMVHLLCRQSDLAVEPTAQLLKQVYASTSWRITAPLRMLGTALKRSS